MTATITKEPDEGKTQCVRGMVWAYRVWITQCFSNRRFKLDLRRVSISSQYLLGFADCDFLDSGTRHTAGQQNHTRDLAQNDAGLGILFKKKHIFNHDQVWIFIPEYIAQSVVYLLEAERLRVFGRCCYCSESKIFNPMVSAFNDADPRARKTRIDSHDLDLHRFGWCEKVGGFKVSPI